MIVAAALCPAAPLLVPGLADALASEVPDLINAVGLAVGGLTAVADRVLVVTVGTRTLRPVAIPSDPGPPPFGRRAEVSAPATTSDLSPLEPGAWVARALAGPDPELVGWQLGSAEPTATDKPAAVAAEYRGCAAAVGVLVLADGAMCHGDDAPSAEDRRAQAFDDSLHAALATEPDQLRTWCLATADLAAELGATAPAALTVLADLLDGVRWTVATRDFGHPFGVGYHVADWRR